MNQPEKQSYKSALRPFTPRVIEIAYASPPKQEIVFLSGDECGSNYPFDPRNLSLLDDPITLRQFDEEIIFTFAGEALTVIT